MLAKTLMFNAAEPFVARAGTRGVIGTLNALIIGLITTHMRLKRFGAPPANDPTVDTRGDEVEGVAEAQEHNTQVREEQGFEGVREEPLIVAARLKFIRDILAENLEANAGLRELPGGTTVKDQWHIGQRLEDTLDFMSTSVQEISPLLIKEEAKALGISEEDARAAMTAQPARQQMFLHRNKLEIVEIYKSMVAADVDGYLVKPEMFEAVLEALSAMHRLQIAASFDRNLYKQYLREIAEHVRTGSPIHKSNVGVLMGVRRQLRDHINAWYEEKGFVEAVVEAQGRGSRIPTMGPKPAVVQPLEAEKVLAVAGTK